jgi:hypothetical protein
MPGRLLSIGSNAKSNDVILPEDGYAQFVFLSCYSFIFELTVFRLQCSLYLVLTGELMLEDSSADHSTYIDWYDKYGRQEKYSLQGDPRRRIIPQAGMDISIGIAFGREVSFQFIWRQSGGADDYKKKLAFIAQATVESNKDMTLTMPQHKNVDPASYEVRTQNTPNVPIQFDCKPLRQIHVYMTIGSGAFGNVSKAVELGTGDIWAVKECRNPKKKLVGDSCKAAFQQEVESLAKLSHVCFLSNCCYPADFFC